MRERAELIAEIAKYESDISAAKNAIQEYPWDCDIELYILTRADILNVFERHLSEAITNEELRNWASFLECREDLGYEKGSEEVIDKVIFWLGNPEINYPINKELVTKLKNQVWENKT
jgi:hypothetical protein